MPVRIHCTCGTAKNNVENTMLCVLVVWKGSSGFAWGASQGKAEKDKPGMRGGGSGTSLQNNWAVLLSASSCCAAHLICHSFIQHLHNETSVAAVGSLGDSCHSRTLQVCSCFAICCVCTAVLSGGTGSGFFILCMSIFWYLCKWGFQNHDAAQERHHLSISSLRISAFLKLRKVPAPEYPHELG